ncbi:uncharacterized protein LOC143836365 [Paroedura picta]|uniref:uncharacterized protein LOC143836365 n=1 Tax=Paroedura picta TaxID=143630 RepID=UPI0040560A96
MAWPDDAAGCRIIAGAPAASMVAVPSRGRYLSLDLTQSLRTLWSCLPNKTFILFLFPLSLCSYSSYPLLPPKPSSTPLQIIHQATLPADAPRDSVYWGQQVLNNKFLLMIGTRYPPCAMRRNGTKPVPRLQTIQVRMKQMGMCTSQS